MNLGIGISDLGFCRDSVGDHLFQSLQVITGLRQNLCHPAGLLAHDLQHHRIRVADLIAARLLIDRNYLAPGPEDRNARSRAYSYRSISECREARDHLLVDPFTL